jgi:hypothetical protein
MKIHRPIDLRAPGAIDALLAFHRTTFGDSVMEAEGGDGGSAGGEGEGAPAGGAGDDEGKGGKDALKADLAKERDKRQALEGTVQQMQASQAAMQEAFAKALGIKPEEASDSDKLAEQVTGLSTKFEELTRANLELSVLNAHPDLSDEDKAVIKKIPDEATMRAVAARLAEASKPSGKPKADPPSGGGGTSQIPADKPGLPRLRAAYAATESN